MSRRVNSIKNLKTSIISEIISIIFNFITRAYFISILGTDYLGVSSLATNILSMLALTEMGFGAAITFHLYKPIADNDIRKLKSILKFFSRIYSYIGITISLIGILIIPFIPYLIKDEIGNINIKLVFGFYLFQTVSSYFFYGYKHSLIRANQKEYIISEIKSYSSIINSILQIAVLIFTRNYYLYVLVTVLSNVFINLVIARKADRLFTYLKDQDVDKISRKERVTIFKDAFAIFFYKIYDKILNSTDTIIISKFLGLSVVGLYSNYLMILSTIQIFLSKFYTSILASLSDLYASDEKERSFYLFKAINLLSVFIFGLVSIIIYSTINIFIELWLGNKYILNNNFVVLFSIIILLNGYRVFFDTFRTSMGLFQKAKYRPVFGAGINVVLSLVLVNIIGINGVILATVIANCLTFMWYDPYIIVKYGYGERTSQFYLNNLKYLFALVVSLIPVRFLSTVLSIGNIPTLFLSITISVFSTLLVFSVFFHGKEEYIFLRNSISEILRVIIGRLLRNRKKN